MNIAVKDEKERIIKIRNAVLESSDGGTVDAAMRGTIMAQGKLIASLGGTPEECRAILDRYYKILSDSFDFYCLEFMAGEGGPANDLA